MPRHSRPRRRAARTRHGAASTSAACSKEISLALVDDVAVGDYVIVHVGYALTRLDPDEAERTLALFAEAGARAGSADGARMKYIDEFRDGALARELAARDRRRGAARAAATASWSSAAATPTPSRATASPTCCRPNVRMIHGPGCPVCVLPIGRIDSAIELGAATAA